MKTKLFYLMLILSFFIFSTSCKEKGCTDRNAINYNPDAEESDGSCKYDDHLKFFGGCSATDTIKLSEDSVYSECYITSYLSEARQYKYSIIMEISMNNLVIGNDKDLAPEITTVQGGTFTTIYFKSKSLAIPDFPKVLKVTYTFERENTNKEKKSISCTRQYQKLDAQNILKKTGVSLGGKNTSIPHFYSMVQSKTFPKDSGIDNSAFIDLIFEDHSDVGFVFWGPTDVEIKWSFSEVESWPTRKSTYFSLTSVTPQQFNAATSDQLILNNSSGITKTNLKELKKNDVIAFKLTNGKMGLILITDKQSPSGSGSGVITFDYIIQK